MFQVDILITVSAILIINGQIQKLKHITTVIKLVSYQKLLNINNSDSGNDRRINKTIIWM